MAWPLVAGLAGGGSLALSPVGALAQVGATPAQVDPSRQAPVAPRPPESSPPLPPRATPPQPQPADPSAEAVTFRVDTVVYEGIDPSEAAGLARLESDVRGKVISLTGLRTLADRIEKDFQRRGFRFTRVIVPEQTIRDGRVTLRVVRGFISDIKVAGGSPKARAAVERLLAPMADGRLWRDSEGERAILLARQIPGIALDATARPGRGAPGAVELLVQIRDEAGDVSVNVNSLGAEALGPYTMFVQGGLNNLTGQADRTVLGLLSTLDSDEQQVVSLTHSAMLGRHGLSARGRISWAKAKPGGDAAALDLDAEVLSGSVEVVWPFVLTRARRLEGSLGLEFVDQENAVLGGIATLTEESLRIATARLSGRYDFAAARAARILAGIGPEPLLPLEVSGALELRQGIDGLGASRKGDPLLTRFGADPAAFVARFELGADYGQRGPFGARLRLSGQTTSASLASFEEYSIGSYTVGRGYEPSAVAGDKGVGGLFELTAGPFEAGPRERRWGRWQAFAFVDAARVWNPGEPGLERRDVASWGVGTRFSLAWGLEGEILWARPTRDPAPNLLKSPDDRVLVNISWRRGFGAR